MKQIILASVSCGTSFYFSGEEWLGKQVSKTWKYNILEQVQERIRGIKPYDIREETCEAKEESIGIDCRKRRVFVFLPTEAIVGRQRRTFKAEVPNRMRMPYCTYSTESLRINEKCC